MDGNNWRATQAEVDAPDWGPDSRQRIVNKMFLAMGSMKSAATQGDEEVCRAEVCRGPRTVARSAGSGRGPWTVARSAGQRMDTLKRLFHISGPEGLLEIKKIAVRLEEKIYHASSSQVDYLRRISLKMLTMEAKSITDVADVLLSNSVVGNQNPADQGPSKRKRKDSEGPTKTKARKIRSSSVGPNLTNDKNKSKINEDANPKEVNTSQRKSAKKTKEENIKTVQLRRSVRFTQ